MRVVLNELSFEDAVLGTAKSWYDTFFDSCISIGKELGSNISVVSTRKPSEIILDEEMPFQKWISLISDLDKKRLIMSMMTREPILFDYPYYSFQESNAIGLGFAFENDLLPLSLNNNEKWRKIELPLRLEYIDESADEVVTDEVNVKNAWDIESSLSHSDFLKRSILSDANSLINEIQSGLQLWDRREELFPSLVFCTQVERQISNLAGDTLKNIFRRLVQMNSYFSSWREGDFDRASIDGNPRLESTTRIRDFESSLTINCPDNEYRLFSFHCNYGIHGMRLHFHPDSEKRICWIGYIGKKIV